MSPPMWDETDRFLDHDPFAPTPVELAPPMEEQTPRETPRETPESLFDSGSMGSEAAGGLGLLGSLLAGLLAALGMGCASGGAQESRGHDGLGGLDAPEVIFVPAPPVEGFTARARIPAALMMPVLAVDRMTTPERATVRDIAHQALAYRTALGVCNARLEVIETVVNGPASGSNRTPGVVSSE